MGPEDGTQVRLGAKHLYTPNNVTSSLMKLLRRSKRQSYVTLDAME